MRSLLIGLFVASCAAAQVTPDRVLVRMAPSGTVSISGARMDELRATPLYQKLISQNKLPDLDRFARETGFDPRRDVRELLLASTGKPDGTVLLARGTFHVTDFGNTRSFKHGDYLIHGDDRSGFCILDSTLAAAGPLPVLYAALDHWHDHDPVAITALLARAAQVPARAQVWSISQGGFNLPATTQFKQGNIDFAQIFRGVQQTTAWADLRTGLDAVLSGVTKTAEDAKNLADAARGVIGIARLSVPEEHRELLKIWDGFHVEQSGASLTVNINVAQPLLDDLMNLIQSGGLGRKPTLHQ